jgi:hypothetical protein
LNPNSEIKVSEHLSVHLKSPNAIDPAQTLTAFLTPVVAGARRFAHTALLRADRALHALRQWLEAIRDHIATSLVIQVDDFDYVPFAQRGGLGKANQVFGNDLVPLLNEMNEVLAA